MGKGKRKGGNDWHGAGQSWQGGGWGSQNNSKPFWRKFVDPSDDPEVIRWCKEYIESFIESGEQQWNMEWVSNETRNTLRDMAPKMGVEWTKVSKGLYALVRCEDMSGDPAELKQNLVDFIRNYVVERGGSASCKDLKWDLSKELRVFMQGQLGIKHPQQLEQKCGKELKEAGLWFNSTGKKILLNGVSEGFADAMYVKLNLQHVREARAVLERTLAALPDKKSSLHGDVFGSFLDSTGSGPLSFDDLEQQRAKSGYQKMLPQRQRLPAFSIADDIVEKVRDCQVVLILGATGCGKTTQIPQFLLEDLATSGSECRILATQPRRISARAVAERVAAERGEKLGETVGYKVRFEDTVGSDTKLVFCTVGILLRIMQSNDDLQGATHLVIDEVHERDLHTDFLLTLVRGVIDRRPDLKVVLMSATVDPSAFQEYFPSVQTVEIPGKTNYPIEELFIEDMLMAHPKLMNCISANSSWKRNAEKLLDVTTDAREIARGLNCSTQVAGAISSLHSAPADQVDFALLVGIIEWIHREKGVGAVLVFVPGWFEIAETMKMLQNSAFGSDLAVYPLHSKIPSNEQQAIFREAPSGKRKVIVSTVLAETSITVEDVVFVVDSGRNKSTFFNESTLIPALKTVWYSKANGLQRRGRAGRCRPGAWYRAYSSLQWDAMSDYELPEMLRSPLEELCLEVASLHLGPPVEFLSSAISPPKMEVAQHAVKLLYNLGAVEDETGAVLTPLGQKLSKLQVHPMLGKMLLLAGLFRCFQPIMTICASLGYKSPFVCPLGKEREANQAKKALAADTSSDHFALTGAYDGWQRGKWRFAQDNFVSGQTMDYIQRLRKDLGDAARDVVTSVPQDHDDQLYLADVCRAVLVAGLYPNVAWVSKRGVGRLLVGGLKAKVHPGSVNAGQPGLYNQLVVYYDIQETTDRWMYDTTVVEMAPLLLFAPDVHEVQREGSRVLLSVGEWHVVVDTKVADEFLGLRRLTAEFINASVGEPTTQLHLSASDALARLFSEHAPVACDDDADEDDDTLAGNSDMDVQSTADLADDQPASASSRASNGKSKSKRRRW